MPDVYEIKEALHTTAMESYRDEYQRFIDIWKGLDTKAQGTVTIAGIFIATVFAFIRDIKNLNLGDKGRWVLIAAIACLVLSVVLSILALTLRKVAAPPTADLIAQMVRDIVRLQPDETAEQNDAGLKERNLSFINERIRLWRQVMAEASEAIKLKYIFLLVGQWLLVGAVFLVVWLTFLVLG